MRRYLLIVLLVLIPFQLVWSAAASVCAHEQPVGGTVHFGHHSPHHEAASIDSTDASADDHHHLPGVNPLPSMPAPALPLARVGGFGVDRIDPCPMALVAGIERPPKILAAVRSAGRIA